MPHPIDFRALDSLSAWDIATLFNCHYSGDSNAIEHGGFFYDSRDWSEYGYANCVELWLYPDAPDDTLHITIGTIHRHKNATSMVADTFGGIPDNPDTLLHMEIDACRSDCGIEPDYDQHKRTYKLSDWKEWRIWKSLSPFLAHLGN